MLLPRVDARELFDETQEYVLSSIKRERWCTFMFKCPENVRHGNTMLANTKCLGDNSGRVVALIGLGP